MDCNVTKETINISKTALENYVEEKTEFDIIIPDYCAAAVRILKCDITPAVTATTINGDKLILDGICTANIMYSDEENGNIKSISETAPFSQSMPLNEELHSHRIKLKLRIGNISCKLQNSRRINAKAIIGIAVKVMGNSEQDIITNVEDCDIETKFEQLQCCVYSNSEISDIKISSEIELDSKVLDIINTETNLKITEIKPLNNKIIVKGEAHVDCLYTTDTSISDIESHHSTIPFSDIIELEGASESGSCDLECSVSGIRTEIGDQTNTGIINVEIEGRVIASAYTNTTLKLLKDAYSREQAVNILMKDIDLESFDSTQKISDNIKEILPLEMDNIHIIQITGRPTVKNISAKDDSVIIDGDICLSIYAHDEKEYRIIDKCIPFSISKDVKIPSCQTRCEAQVYINDIDYSMPEEGKLELSVDIEFSVMFFCRNMLSIVDSIDTGSENTPKQLASKVILYYANKGEQLWDIAKKYYTSVSILKRDNNLNDAVINDDKMILISRF